MSDNEKLRHLIRQRSDRQNSYVKPSEEYVNIVRDGLKRFGFSDEMLNAAAKHKPTPFLIDSLPFRINSFFCYGTLRKGECRYNVMNELEIQLEQPATVCGKIYNLGSFPGITLTEPDDTEPDKLVHGELIHVQNVHQAIQKLDAIEGFHGFGANNLYNRKIVPVKIADGTIQPAWIYEYAGSCSQQDEIESGDWLKR